MLTAFLPALSAKSCSEMLPKSDDAYTYDIWVTDYKLSTFFAEKSSHVYHMVE